MEFDGDELPDEGRSRELIEPFRVLEEQLRLLGRMVSDGYPVFQNREEFAERLEAIHNLIELCLGRLTVIREGMKSRHHFKIEILVTQLNGVRESLNGLRYLDSYIGQVGPFRSEPGGEALFDLAGRAIVEYGKDVKEFVSFYMGLVEREHRALSSAAAPSKLPDPATLVEVMFGTDRKPDTTSVSNILKFLPGRGDGKLHLGMAEVSIPKSHRIGKMERPAIWKLQFRENADNHIMLTECREMAEGDWVTRVQAMMEKNDCPEVFVFVHGFNVHFDEAMRRAAQVGLDIEFPGVIAAYSWGSEEALGGYDADGDGARLSAEHLLAFLEVIRTKVGAQSIHIVAHSMGNRVLIEAMQKMNGVPPASSRLDQVVFAAPDVDAMIFKKAVGGLGGYAKRFTLYGSEKDSALTASKGKYYGYPRAGAGGDNLVVMDGVDSIDATNTNAELLSLGHTYIAGKPRVIGDLKQVIRQPGIAASARRGLIEKSLDKLKYYVFRKA